MITGKGHDSDRTALGEIKRLGECTAEFRGDIHKAPFSGRPCLWFWWGYGQDGEPDGGHVCGGHTDSLLRLVTPSGGFDLHPRCLRTSLAPSYRGRAEVEDREAFVTEFCIEAGRTYHVRVERETYPLPPLLHIIPRRRSVLVLAVSDIPFDILKKGQDRSASDEVIPPPVF